MMRETPISYGRQWIEEDDIEAVVKVLRSPFLTCGPTISEAERCLTDYTGAKHAVVVSNGTAALHCACMAAGIGEGDEVITTSLTFAASANCVRYCGGTPVFADVDPDTYNIDPASVEAHITEKTKAVIAVDYTGQAVRHKEIRAICEKHGLLFIEDAAHAIGTCYDGRPVGSLADMTCFSFHPVKTVTSGEGGAVTTNREDLYEKLVLAHAHGITHDVLPNADGEMEPWYYEQVSLGYNYRMTDFQAALLISQMKKLERFKARRREIAARYDEVFRDMPELILQKTIPESDTCPHLYVLRINPEKMAMNRRDFFMALRARNIQPQVHYIPTYWFPYYRELGYQRGLCPHAEAIYETILSIPLFPLMTDQDVQDVIEAVKLTVEQGRKETPM